MALLPPKLIREVGPYADDMGRLITGPNTYRSHPPAASADPSDVQEVVRTGIPEDVARAIRQHGPAASNEVSHLNLGGEQPEREGWFAWAADVPNKVFMYTMLPFMPLGFLTKTLGGWLDGKNAPEPGRVSKAGHLMTAHIRFANQSFGDAGELLKVGKPAGAAIGKVSGVIGRPLDWLFEATGFSGWREKRHGMHAKTHYDSAMGILNGEHGVKIENALSSVKGLEKYKNILTEVRDTSGDAARMAELTPKLYDFHRATKAVHPHNIPAGARENIQGLAEGLRDSAYHSQCKVNFQQKKGASKAYEVWKNAPVGHSLWNAGFVAADTIALFGEAKTFKEGMYSVKKMLADMEHRNVDDISNWEIMTRRLPQPVAQARAQLLKVGLLGGGLKATGLGFSFQFLRGGHMGGKTMALQMGTALGGETLKGFVTPSIATYYGNLSDAQNSGKHLSAEMYDDFLQKLDPRMAHKKSTNVRHALAKKFAQENKPLGDILNLHARHELRKLGDVAAKELDKANPPAPATAEQASPGSHVASIGSNGKKLLPPPIENGKFTTQLHKEVAQTQKADEILHPAGRI